MCSSANMPLFVEFVRFKAVKYYQINVTDSLFVSFPEGSIHHEFSCEIMAENPGRVLYIFRLQQRLWSR